MKGDDYEQSLKRMDRSALIVTATGIAALLINSGWHTALGFLCGAVMSFFNFRLWKRITAAVGEQGAEASSDSKAIALGARYLLIGGAVFAIIKVLDVSVLAVVGGLLVTVAALLVELVRQIVRPGS